MVYHERVPLWRDESNGDGRNRTAVHKGAGDMSTCVLGLNPDNKVGDLKTKYIKSYENTLFRDSFFSTYNESRYKCEPDYVTPLPTLQTKSG